MGGIFTSKPEEITMLDMGDYYLKASSEANLMESLATAELLDENLNPLGVSLDILGVIYKPTATVDLEGNPVMAPLPGYHANLRGILSSKQYAALQSLMIEAPATPTRVWA